MNGQQDRMQEEFARREEERWYCWTPKKVGKSTINRFRFAVDDAPIWYWLIDGILVYPLWINIQFIPISMMVYRMGIDP